MSIGGSSGNREDPRSHIFNRPPQATIPGGTRSQYPLLHGMEGANCRWIIIVGCSRGAYGHRYYIHSVSNGGVKRCEDVHVLTHVSVARLVHSYTRRRHSATGCSVEETVEVCALVQ
nr:hypothetical protein Iba_scaffold49042CG0010 [Ipomoea batatas]